MIRIIEENDSRIVVVDCIDLDLCVFIAIVECRDATVIRASLFRILRSVRFIFNYQ